MGGYGSTRWGYRARRCTIEESLRIRIPDLRRYLSDPEPQSLDWQWMTSGKRVASVHMAFSPANEQATLPRGRCRRSLTLSYSIVVSHYVPERFELPVEVWAEHLRFGGLRWWFVCPRCWRRRAALYLPTVAGARTWACRQCCGLRYHSQRLSPIHRTERKMRRIVARLDPNHTDFLEFPLLGKPKRMRWATFSRHHDAWQRADAARDSLYCPSLLRLLARLERY